MTRYRLMVGAAVLTLTSVILAHGRPNLAVPLLASALCLGLIAFRK